MNSYAKTLIVVVLSALALTLAIPTFALDPAADSYEELYAGDMTSDFLWQINSVRCELGLNPVVMNDQLFSAAARHALDLGYNQTYDHIGTDGTTVEDRVNQAGYTGYAFVGQNIAVLQASEFSYDEAFNQWWERYDDIFWLGNPHITEVSLALVTSYNTITDYWVLNVGSRNVPIPTCQQLEY